MSDSRTLILAIEITSEFGSLALADGDRLIEEVPLHSTEGYSSRLFGAISELLERHHRTIRDIKCFAAGAGPGTFTGIRMGLTAAVGFAEACDAKVVAVSNLQALVWFGTQPVRAPLIDARRGEVYGGFYDADLQPLREEVVTTLEQWSAMVSPEAEVIVNGPLEVQGRRITVAPRELACAVVSIAAGVFAKGQAKDPAEIDANYVRRTDAANMWRDPK